jgi:hypothetical protein
MTDEQLAEFLCPDDPALGLRIVTETMTPERRATYERMAEVVDEIGLYEAGVGTKPKGVILCGPKQIKRAGIEKPERNTMRRPRP